MGKDTAIQWCDSTHNGWIGCTEVSTEESGGGGCDNCYARELDKRYRWGGATHWGAGVPRMRTSAANWRKPITWNATPFYECRECGWRGENDYSGCPTCAAEIHTTRRRVFCHSLADVADNEVPRDWRVDLSSLIEATPNLDWLMLTKRIGNFKSLYAGWTLPPNVWLGITVVNQMEADRDIPKLLAIPARVRFLSCEPLLGPIDLTSEYLADKCGGVYPFKHLPREHRTTRIEMLDWVISGGESGPKARPSHPDWHRSLRDQCAAAGVPFLFKQHGEWIGVPDLRRLSGGGGPGFGIFDHRPFDREHEAVRIGKKAAGRMLDGREHNEFPETK